MFPQRSTAAARAASSRGQGQLALCDLGLSCLNPALRASSNLSNLSKLSCWLQEGEFPLSLQCVGGTCPSPGNIFPQMPAQEHKAGHRAHGAFAGTTGPGKQQLFLAQGSILGLRLTASFVQSTWGFEIRASAGFQVPAMGETSFCPRVNNGLGSLPWECLTTTCRVLHLCKTWQSSAKCLRTCAKVTKFYKNVPIV